MQSEKRKSERVRIAVDITAESSHQFYAGITGDLGHGGVFFVSHCPPPTGTPVRVCMRLPAGGRVDAFGIVRWVRTPELAEPGLPPGCGISWEAIGRRSLATLRRLLARAGRPVFDGAAASV
jgi:hypothetical protein